MCKRVTIFTINHLVKEDPQPYVRLVQFCYKQDIKHFEKLWKLSITTYQLNSNFDVLVIFNICNSGLFWQLQQSLKKNSDLIDFLQKFQ